MSPQTPSRSLDPFAADSGWIGGGKSFRGPALTTDAYYDVQASGRTGTGKHITYLNFEVLDDDGMTHTISVKAGFPNRSQFSGQTVPSLDGTNPANGTWEDYQALGDGSRGSLTDDEKLLYRGSKMAGERRKDQPAYRVLETIGKAPRPDGGDGWPKDRWLDDVAAMFVGVRFEWGEEPDKTQKTKRDDGTDWMRPVVSAILEMPSAGSVGASTKPALSKKAMASAASSAASSSNGSADALTAKVESAIVAFVRSKGGVIDTASKGTQPKDLVLEAFKVVQSDAALKSQSNRVGSTISAAWLSDASRPWIYNEGTIMVSGE